MGFFADSLRAAIGSVSPFGRLNNAPIVNPVFSHLLALSAYRSSGMLRKTITIPADDRVREWRDWQADKDQIEALETEEKRLGIIGKVRHAEVLRGIGGGALILVTAGDHATPLNPDAIGANGLVAINVVTRWQLSGRDFVRDLASPDFGLPQMWEMQGQAGQTRIHPSRVICFRGDPLPAGTELSDEDAFWGDSRLIRVMREVQNSDNTQDWFAALVKKAKLLRIGIPNLVDFNATAEGQTKLDSRVRLIAEGESSLNATVYDAGNGNENSGEKITDYQVTWTGIPAIMDAFDQRIAAVSDIPFTRLTGRSPAGMNATGQHDMDNWNKAVVAGQKLELRPCLEALDPVLIRSAGVDPAKVTWRFAPLDTPSEKEEADTFKTTIEALTALQNTGAIPDLAFTKGVQNLMSEREWIPGLDQALAEIPEDERFGIAAEPDQTDPSALTQPQGGGDPNLRGETGTPPPARRAANDAWMMEDWAAQPLYVRRDVVNRAEIIAWAKGQGFTDIVPDLHVTITYSRAPVDWMKMGESWRGKLEIEPGGPRLVEALGPDGKYKALLFTAYELVSRNQEMRDKGASFDWPEYQPHISIQVGGDVDLAKVEPYRGKIVLGPEIFEAIREGGA